MTTIDGSGRAGRPVLPARGVPHSSRAADPAPAGTTRAPAPPAGDARPVSASDAESGAQATLRAAVARRLRSLSLQGPLDPRAVLQVWVDEVLRHECPQHEAISGCPASLREAVADAMARDAALLALMRSVMDDLVIPPARPPISPATPE